MLKKKPDAASEEIVQVEKLIAEAYSVIDKAVEVGTLHRNTGARRKSRLAPILVAVAGGINGKEKKKKKWKKAAGADLVKLLRFTALNFFFF